MELNKKRVTFLALLFALFMWLLRSVNFHPDGLDYAHSVKIGAGLFHPHHILYSPIAFLIYKIIPVTPISACQIEQLIFSSLLFYVSWRTGSRLLGNVKNGLLATLLLVSSRGVLQYTTGLEVYLPALTATTFLINELTKKRKSQIKITLFLSMSILLHQTNVLLIIPLFFLLNFRRYFITTASSGLIVILIYLVSSGSDNLLDYIFRYANADIPVWGSFTHFNIDGISSLGANLWRAIIPLPVAIEFVFGMITIVLLLLLAILVFRKQNNQLLRFSGIWLFSYLLFVLWWLPTDQDFMVATLAPLWLITILTWNKNREKISPKFIIIVIVLFAVVNIGKTVLPNHILHSDAFYEAKSLHKNTPADKKIKTSYEVQQNLKYFYDRESEEL
jgi:hypothetical protein